MVVACRLIVGPGDARQALNFFTPEDSNASVHEPEHEESKFLAHQFFFGAGDSNAYVMCSQRVSLTKTTKTAQY